VTDRHLRLGVALDDAGAHPAAWRSPGADVGLFSADRLVRLARTAERGGLDFVALDDGFDPPDRRSAALPARFDALLALARVAPATTTIGLLPTVTTTHTEPFHVSKNVATLDLVSGGRAGWRVAVSTSPEAALAFGRTDPRPLDTLWAEAEDAIEVANRLWDSWEDDAVIRDPSTGRYIDRNKLHYIDFVGEFFSVRGPSITPRSPQGQPLVAIDAHGPDATAVATRRADIVFIDAADLATAWSLRHDIRRLIAAAGRDPDRVAVLANVRVGEPGQRRQLDRIGRSIVSGFGGPGGLDLVSEASDVAEVLDAWFLEGAVDGFLIRPDALPATLDWFVDDVVPRLATRGLSAGHPGNTLRDRFGLERPPNRYADAAVST
jgi:alkanesulfonate monooxygenase SsuD/methylene tetrahydromethanopterin reductase-like flavin-dependent oxidoreductase (luciferase family)